jgi:hypothetical protein
MRSFLTQKLSFRETVTSDQRLARDAERLEGRSHSTPEREPVQGVLESSRITRVPRSEKGRSCLCRGEHA